MKKCFKYLIKLNWKLSIQMVYYFKKFIFRIYFLKMAKKLKCKDNKIVLIQ